MSVRGLMCKDRVRADQTRCATRQVMKTDKEQRLLSASKTFDSGLSRFNLGAWDDVLANDVTLHKDGVTLMNDLHGRNSVKGYFQVCICAISTVLI